MPGRGKSEGVRLLAEFDCAVENQLNRSPVTGGRGVNEGIGGCVEFVVDLPHAAAPGDAPLAAHSAQQPEVAQPPGPTHSPERMKRDLVSRFCSYASVAGIPLEERAEWLDDVASAIVLLLPTNGTKRRACRWMIRALVVYCIALRDRLPPSHHRTSTLIGFIRSIMEEGLTLPPPSEARLCHQTQDLIRCLEMPVSEKAAEATYQLLVTLYGLRPVWATFLGLSWLFQ